MTCDHSQMAGEPYDINGTESPDSSGGSEITGYFLQKAASKRCLRAESAFLKKAGHRGSSNADEKCTTVLGPDLPPGVLDQKDPQSKALLLGST